MSLNSAADGYLFVGTHGHVVAVDKLDGHLVWDTSLPKTGFQVVVILIEDGKVLCGTAGRLFALDPLDGSVLWENSLPGLGQGIVALCTVRQSAELGSAVAAQAAASAAASQTATNTATS